mmetsp:Transcript_6722/g.12699  ORF Transcript_6722/g.12699 Transcript_6722/m.12699 type:complete len:202 (+) Transcript_6722:606-1211(+)
MDNQCTPGDALITSSAHSKTLANSCFTKFALNLPADIISHSSSVIFSTSTSVASCKAFDVENAWTLMLLVINVGLGSTRASADAGTSNSSMPSIVRVFAKAEESELPAMLNASLALSTPMAVGDPVVMPQALASSTTDDPKRVSSPSRANTSPDFKPLLFRIWYAAMGPSANVDADSYGMASGNLATKEPEPATALSAQAP